MPHPGVSYSAINPKLHNCSAYQDSSLKLKGILFHNGTKTLWGKNGFKTKALLLLLVAVLIETLNVKNKKANTIHFRTLHNTILSKMPFLTFGIDVFSLLVS